MNQRRIADLSKDVIDRIADLPCAKRLECGGLTPLSLRMTRRRRAESGVKPPHSKLECYRPMALNS